MGKKWCCWIRLARTGRGEEGCSYKFSRGIESNTYLCRQDTLPCNRTSVFDVSPGCGCCPTVRPRRMSPVMSL